MHVRNLDGECYRDAVARQRAHQEAWLTKGYAPRGFYVKDFCLLEQDGIFHLFHIAGTPGVSCCLPGNELWFGHATTRDFCSWDTLEPCFYVAPGAWDGGHVFAPYVVAHCSTFWMFYTGCAIDNTQRIGIAVSEDLHHWRRLFDQPVIRPEIYPWAFCPTSGGSACRDAHVSRWNDTFSLYYTAVTADGRACVARASSRNLLQWNDEGPAYISNGLLHCESSNVQEIDGRYLLFFGGHHEYWSYVISDNPYHWPAQQPRPLGHRLTAMEVVRRRDPHWLVAYFTFDSYRLYLGEIDWSVNEPRIRQIDHEKELARYDLPVG